jgi:hypothetical protein
MARERANGVSSRAKAVVAVIDDDPRLLIRPSDADLDEIAAILNRSEAITSYAGAGCAGGHDCQFKDRVMDASVISALAALAGAAVGGLTSVVANWLGHRIQVRAQWFQREKNRRQVLYCDFIEEASKCYIDALQHDEADVPSLVRLYAKLSRMRVLSSKSVVDNAQTITRKILDVYLEPDKSFVELRDMARNGTIDLLREFSTACRQEFEDMEARQF